MRRPREFHRDRRLRVQTQTGYGMTGEITINGWTGTFVCGYDEDGMEHVSVSPYDHSHTPTWDEMCEVKDIFWTDEEECVQFFPRKSEYVNLMENCLHIWRRVDGKGYGEM